MSEKCIKVVTACFTGGGIGSLIALQFGQFWPVGLVIGCLIGYLSYNWQEVIKSIINIKNGFTPPNFGQYIYLILFFGLEFFFHSQFFVFLILYVSMYFTHYDPVIIANRLFPSFLFCELVILFGGIFLSYFFLNKNTRHHKREKFQLQKFCVKNLLINLWPTNYDYQKIIYEYYEPPLFFLIYAILSNIKIHIILLLGILGVIAGGIFSVLCILWGIISIVLGLLKSLFLIFKKIFLTIHSELRLLCAVDAGVGVVIGYLCGNPLVGAIVGGLTGVINFELFSKRLLKIPQKN